MWRQLWTMTASDLRQRIRDRSVIIFSLVVPLALMFVMNLTFGDTEEAGGLEPVTVAAAVPPGDPLAATVVDSLAEAGAMEVTVDRVEPDAVRSRAEAGEADIGVVVPQGFGDSVRRGEPVTVDVVEGDEAGVEADVVISILRATLDQLAAGTQAAVAAEGAGVDGGALTAVAERAATQGPAVDLVEGRTASEQLSLSGALVAGQAGLFLLFTVGFGVLGIVVEREQGTLARLRSMPMRPGLVVAAKGLVGYILGVVATVVLLGAGSLMFSASFGDPVVVAVLILAAVAAGTSLMFIVARVARTAEQASVAQSILAIGLGTLGGAFFPITASGVLGALVDLNPVGAFIRGLGVSAGGGGLEDVAGLVATMLAFAAVSVVISRVVPDRGRSL